MLWRSSIEMGVARYWNATKNYLAIVAFYRPGGNSNAPGKIILIKINLKNLGEFAINLPSKAEVPEDARSATQLENLILSLNRASLNDGGFKPPSRHYSSPPK